MINYSKIKRNLLSLKWLAKNNIAMKRFKMNHAKEHRLCFFEYSDIILILININNVRILSMIYYLKINKHSLLSNLHNIQISPKHTSRFGIIVFNKTFSFTLMKKIICKENVTRDSLNAEIIYKIKIHYSYSVFTMLL